MTAHFLRIFVILTLCAWTPFAASVQATSTLLIGDSHSTGAFGLELDRLFRAVPGKSTATYASCGSSPQWWIKGTQTRCGYFEKDEGGAVRRTTTSPTPLLSMLLEKLKPETVVVQLGTNQLGEDPNVVAQSVQQLVRLIRASGGLCIWIGPPDIRLKAEFLDPLYDVLQRTTEAAGCALIDSRLFPDVRYPATGGDGIHFDSIRPQGVKIAESWARQVSETVKAILEISPRSTANSTVDVTFEFALHSQ